MALIRGKSGSIQFPNLYHLFARINWWEDYSIEGNYSIISAQMEMMAEDWEHIGYWYPGGDSPAKILVGDQVIATLNYVTAEHSAELIATNTWVKVQEDGAAAVWSSGKIYHNGDGTASTTIATTHFKAYRINGDKYFTFGTASPKTIVLTTIPRKSEITSASAVTLGKACSVTWTPLSAGFRYQLQFRLGAWSHTTDYITPNTTAPYTYTGYTLPMEVARQLPEAAAGEMTVTLYTYNGSAPVGEASAAFGITVPETEATKPTIADLTLLPEDSPFPGVFLQGGSRVRAAFTGEGRYGASVASREMTVEGKTYSGDCISHPLMGYGHIRVTLTVTDTRGFTRSVEQDIYVCPYSKPQVQVRVCERCDENGLVSDSGAYLTIEAMRSYSKVMIGPDQFNFCRLRYRCARQGTALPEWTTILEDNDQSDSVNTGALQLNLAKDAIYIVEVGVSDTVGNTSQTAYTVMTEAVFMHEKAGGKGIGFGMYCQGDNQMDVAWDAHFHGGVIIYPDPNNPNECKTLHDYIKAVISEGG